MRQPSYVLTAIVFCAMLGPLGWAMAAQAATDPAPPGVWPTLMNYVSDPSVAYTLLILGCYALLLELFNPGMVVPALVGIVLIALGSYGLHLLSVNYAGMALLMLGMGLIVAEVITPNLGILGVAGLVAFVLGSNLLFDGNSAGLSVPVALIAAFATATALVVFAVVGLAVKVRRRAIATGSEAMTGSWVEALSDFNPAGGGDYIGRVRASGEIWQARSTRPVSSGEKLSVHRLDGLVLHVKQTKKED